MSGASPQSPSEKSPSPGGEEERRPSPGGDLPEGSNSGSALNDRQPESPSEEHKSPAPPAAAESPSQAEGASFYKDKIAQLRAALRDVKQKIDTLPRARTSAGVSVPVSNPKSRTKQNPQISVTVTSSRHSTRKCENTKRPPPPNIPRALLYQTRRTLTPRDRRSVKRMGDTVEREYRTVRRTPFDPQDEEWLQLSKTFDRIQRLDEKPKPRIKKQTYRDELIYEPTVGKYAGIAWDCWCAASPRTLVGSTRRAREPHKIRCFIRRRKYILLACLFASDVCAF